MTTALLSPNELDSATPDIARATALLLVACQGTQLKTDKA